MSAETIALTLDGPAISVAVEEAQTRLEAQGVDSRAAMHVALTLDELLTNALTHGGGQGRPADIRLTALDDRVEVEVVDGAAPFDPRSAPAPKLDTALAERAIGGLGVHLVMKLSRDLSYGWTGERNRTHYWIARETRHD